MSKTVTAVVVAYNIHCADSPTCRALEAVPDIPVVIYDNSTKDMDNRAYCEDRGWCYLGGDGNVGLSKAYNTAIDHIKRHAPTDRICLFDDDTELDARYFEALDVADDGQILVPLIFSAGQLISPCRIDTDHRVHTFDDAQAALDYEGKDLSAINSCMAIDLSIFDEYRYNENIFLDGIDHHFMLDMHPRGVSVSVFDYHCNHAFSGYERPSKQAALIRFGIYAKDYAYILRHNRRAYRRLVGKRALHLTLTYRSLLFFDIYAKTKELPNESLNKH